jgi:hypothetical protein
VPPAGDELVHEYHVEPAESSFALTVLVLAGLIENATASILLGSDEFSV